MFDTVGEHYTPQATPAPEMVPTFQVRIQHNFRLRRTEWLAGFQSLLFGLVLLLPIDTFAGPSFTFFSRIAPENVWGLVLLLLGVARLIGLFINGARGKITARVRFWSAVLGCGVFTAVSLCFIASGNPSTWIAAWPVLAIIEYLNVYDTARDNKIANG